MENNEHIVFFDGVCNLCNAAVQFILKYDHKKIFRFAPLQSTYATQRLGPDISNDTFIYLENGQQYNKSTGALKIARHLHYFKYVYFLIYIPRFIRDFFYDLIARSRYQVFGKKDECMIPDKDLADRFIH